MVKLAAAGLSLGGVGGTGGSWLGKGMCEADDCGLVPIGACVGDRVVDGKSKTSSCSSSSFMRFVVDPYWTDGRRDGIRDHEVVFVLFTLQSTPRGLLRAPNASTDHPNRV